MFLNKRIIYDLFFVTLLATEFFYINVGGGVARIYHFFAILIVLLLSRSIPKLFESKVFFLVLLFAFVNLVAAGFSDTSPAALFSFASFMANVGVATATALILLRKKYELDRFRKLILFLSIIGVVWGLIQIFAYTFAGLTLALSYEQETQIQIGFGPGFRTEANTFGKYMILPIMLFLPEYIHKQRGKSVKLIFLLFLVGVIMNFTRSSIYGMGVAVLFVFVWYLVSGKAKLFAQRGIGLAVAITFGISLIISGGLNVSDYARYKIENFFAKEEIIDGQSSAFRLELMRVVIEGTLNDPKKMLIGNGWGQTRAEYNGEEIQAGGGDIVNVLGFSGALGVVLYLVYMFVAFLSARRVALTSLDPEKSRFAEGVMFSLVGIFATAQMSGYLIAPEYWMLIGVCIYLDIIQRPQGFFGRMLHI